MTYMGDITRPWKVFVRDIGPTISFAHEERARAKAQALIDEGYAEVLVFRSGASPFLRTVYRYDAEPRTERLTFGGRWESFDA